MALYDNKFDWYDVWLPGSTATSIFSKGENGSSYAQRVVDPTTVEQQYNTAERLASQEFNERQVEKQRAFDAEQAQLNRDFQERLSNTAYTRAVQDIKNAGLNPYAFLGSGASTPVGATATSGSAYSTPQRITGGSTSHNAIQLLSIVANTALGLAKMPVKTSFKVGF